MGGSVENCSLGSVYQSTVKRHRGFAEGTLTRLRWDAVAQGGHRNLLKPLLLGPQNGQIVAEPGQTHPLRPLPIENRLDHLGSQATSAAECGPRTFGRRRWSVATARSSSPRYSRDSSCSCERWALAIATDASTGGGPCRRDNFAGLSSFPRCDSTHEQLVRMTGEVARAVVLRLRAATRCSSNHAKPVKQIEANNREE